MNKERTILSFKLPTIWNFAFINVIVMQGYRKTGQKFTVQFNGSKGYLSNIEIFCEGNQIAENRIWIERLSNKNGSLKSVLINIYYSEENGVRISEGKDERRIINDAIEFKNEIL